MACELWLVRHGQASFDAADYDQLTDLGFQQARWLGEHLKDMETGFDWIAAGTLRRQQQTAETVAEVLEEPSGIVPGLEEYDSASLLRAAGHTDRDPSRSRAEHFQLLRGVLLDWSAGKAVGAETWVQFEERVMAAISELTAGKKGRVLAASSGGAIAMALTRILGLGAERMIEFNLQARNTGVSRLIFTRRTVYLNAFNTIPHLERPDRRHAETYS